MVFGRRILVGLPYGYRYSYLMRPLRYSINVTLDGCCDHRAMLADEDLHRHAVENLVQADALLFGRMTLPNDGGSVAAVGADGREARLDGILRPDDRRGKEVRRVEHLGPGPLERVRPAVAEPKRHRAGRVRPRGPKVRIGVG